MIESLQATGTVTYDLEDCSITFYVSYRSDQFDTTLEVIDVDQITCGEIEGEYVIYKNKKIPITKLFYALDEYVTSDKSIIEILQQEVYKVDKTIEEIIQEIR